MTPRQPDPPTTGIPIVGAVEADDHLEIVRRNGDSARAIPGGHAHPAGWSDEPPATRRRS